MNFTEIVFSVFLSDSWDDICPPNWYDIECKLCLRKIGCYMERVGTEMLYNFIS